MKTRLSYAALAAALAIAAPAAAQQGAAPLPAAGSPVAPLATAGSPVGPPATPASPKAAVWGFVNVQYGRTDALGAGKDSATFETRRARIGARGEITPHVGYAVLFEGTDASVKDAYVQLKRLAVPGIEVRAGQWKTPFGYEQPESDTKLLWVNGSYAVQSLARSTTTAKLTDSPDARDVGVGFIGKWVIVEPLGAELAASYVTGAGPSRKDDLDEKNFWGRAGAVARLGRTTLRAGGSYGTGRQVADLGPGSGARFDGLGAPVDDTYFYFQTYGADVTVDTPFLFAAAEIIQSERDVSAYAAGVPRRTGYTARGWYAGLYGKTPWNVGPVFRAEQYDRDLGRPDAENERYTVGAYVDVLPVNARLIFNYEFDESDRSVRTGDRAIAFGQVVF